MIPIAENTTWQDFTASAATCGGGFAYYTGSQIGLLAVDQATGAAAWNHQAWAWSNFACASDGNELAWVDRHDRVWLGCYAGEYAGWTHQIVLGVDGRTGRVLYNISVPVEDDDDTHVRTAVTSDGTDVLVVEQPEKGRAFVYNL